MSYEFYRKFYWLGENRMRLIAVSLIVLFAVVVSDANAGESTKAAEPKNVGGVRCVQTSAPFLANGVKIGELTSNSVIIWTRLTQNKEVKSGGVSFTGKSGKQKKGKQKEGKPQDPKALKKYYGAEGGYAKQVPAGKKLSDVNGSVAGCDGESQLHYWQKNTRSATKTDWEKVSADNDYTQHYSLEDLKPGTTYGFKISARKVGGTKITSSLESEFTTAAAAKTPSDVSFVVVTGTQWEERDNKNLGFNMYKAMGKLNPNFLVHTGDAVYYDKPKPFVTSIDLARLRWTRMYSAPLIREFHNRIPIYIMKDDHDTWQNDCWPTAKSRMGNFTFQQGQKVFNEQFPMSTPKHYRTFRWGKDVQIWLVDVRNFRAPNRSPDGPKKSMWGKEQVEWFKKTVKASNATFRILISPTPMVGPDHRNKARTADNHVDKLWKHEGDMLRKFVSDNNMYFICGDRHWQYLSKDKTTGLLEYSCGPGSDEHAVALKNNPKDPRILFYRPKGGFLRVAVTRKNKVPIISLKFHGVDGKVHHSSEFKSGEKPGDTKIERKIESE